MKVHEPIVLFLVLLRVICAKRSAKQATAGLLCYSGTVEMDETNAKDNIIQCKFPDKFCQITVRFDRDGKIFKIIKGCSATQCTKKVTELAHSITRWSRCCNTTLCNAELKPRSTSITLQRSVTQEVSGTPRMSVTQPSTTQRSTTQPPRQRTNAASLGTRGMQWLYCYVTSIYVTSLMFMLLQ